MLELILGAENTIIPNKQTLCGIFIIYQTTNATNTLSHIFNSFLFVRKMYIFLAKKHFSTALHRILYGYLFNEWENGRKTVFPSFIIGKMAIFRASLFFFFFVYERFSWDNLCLLEFCRKIYVRSSSRATFAQSHFINLIFCRAEWRKTHLIPCLPDYYYYASYQH